MLLRGVRYVAWVITAAAVIVYLAMVFVTLPHLAALTRGLPVFDLRLLGYDFGTAQELIARLGADGAAYYENVPAAARRRLPGAVVPGTPLLDDRRRATLAG